MPGDINIKIAVVGAEQAAASVDKLDNTMGKLGKTVPSAGAALAKLDPALNKAAKSSDVAGQSLTNLGRIAQDAPFGFIGIQNNISPLLESFQRLKAETGSTGSALKALASGLTGAGGLGLAVSVATGVLTVLAQSGFFKTKNAAKESTDAVKAYKEELSGIAAQVAKEASGVAGLVATLRSEVTTREQKLEAIKKLNAVSPQTFGALKLEEGAVVGLTTAYNSYIASLERVYAAKIIQNKLDKEFQKLIELEGATRTKQEKGNRALLNFYTGVDTAASKAIRRTGQLTVNFSQSLDPIIATKGRIEELTAALQEFADPKAAPVKLAKTVETIADVIARLRRELAGISAEEDAFGIDKSKDKIREIESAISTLVRKFKVDPKGGLIQGLFGEIKDLLPGLQRDLANIKIKTSAQILVDQAQAEKEINDKLGKDVRIKPIKLPADLFDATNALIAFQKSIEAANEAAANNLKDTFNSAFASVGESIGDSLSKGADFGQTVFGNLFKVLGAGLKQLGEAMVAIGTAKIALEKFQFAPGIGTVVAGIATIAIGQILQNALPGFADGVTNFGGGLAVVGERGPELVRLPSGSDVIPNHQLNNVGAGRMPIEITGFGILRGNDIYMSYNRAAKTSQRNS